MELAEIRADYRKLKLIIPELRALEAKYGELHIAVNNRDVPLVTKVFEMMVSLMKAAYVVERQNAAQAAVDAAIQAEG